MRVAAGLAEGDPQHLGDYRLAGRLSSGRRSVVYEAYDSGGRRVVVRVPCGDPEPWRPLAGEVAAARDMTPFCTAEIIDAGCAGPRPYIVSEFVAGPSLRGLGRVLAGDDLYRLAVGVATALAALHEAGVVHRDLTPDAVLLGRDGPRVAGFGMARTARTKRASPRLTVGAPGYTAPETFTGDEAAAPADVFAWGATVLYAATGEDPFTGDSLGAVMHRVFSYDPDVSPLPASLRPLVAAALDKDPLGRPSARELLLALVRQHTRALSEETVDALLAARAPLTSEAVLGERVPLVEALLAAEAPLTMDFLLAAGEHVAAGLRVSRDESGPGAAGAGHRPPPVARGGRARLAPLAMAVALLFALVIVVIGMRMTV
ncbi:serine/threonine-protein kinase [Streptosporangium sp. NPDC051022]|uniref:serine/threonine-protein kinase n=1 Tax=Streptosporangium sp. NPDC051022 TaxID=3155752 RepID=UPI00343DFB64